MHLRAVLFAILLYACGALAAEPVPLNCSLTAPPSDAGDFIAADMELRVFPRLAEVTDDYVGCQSAWTENVVGGWLLLARVYFVSGSPTALTLPQFGTTADRPTCYYSNQRLESGPIEHCLPFDRLRLRSMPSGCGALALRGEPLPARCRLDGDPGHGRSAAAHNPRP